jgi:hypothetical protein
MYVLEKGHMATSRGSLICPMKTQPQPKGGKGRGTRSNSKRMLFSAEKVLAECKQQEVVHTKSAQ